MQSGKITAPEIRQQVIEILNKYENDQPSNAGDIAFIGELNSLCTSESDRSAVATLVKLARIYKFYSPKMTKNSPLAVQILQFFSDAFKPFGITINDELMHLFSDDLFTVHNNIDYLFASNENLQNKFNALYELKLIDDGFFTRTYATPFIKILHHANNSNVIDTGKSLCRVLTEYANDEDLFNLIKQRETNKLNGFFKNIDILQEAGLLDSPLKSHFVELLKTFPFLSPLAVNKLHQLVAINNKNELNPLIFEILKKDKNYNIAFIRINFFCTLYESGFDINEPALLNLIEAQDIDHLDTLNKSFPLIVNICSKEEKLELAKQIVKDLLDKAKYINHIFATMKLYDDKKRLSLEIIEALLKHPTQKQVVISGKMKSYSFIHSFVPAHENFVIRDYSFILKAVTWLFKGKQDKGSAFSTLPAELLISIAALTTRSKDSYLDSESSLAIAGTFFNTNVPKKPPRTEEKKRYRLRIH